jgi:hypothetical protein
MTIAAKLEDFSTVDLLAEVDRRTRAARPPIVHFFGVWPGERAGHYRRDVNGKMISYGAEGVPGRKCGLYPWETYCVNGAAPQVQGKLWHWHHPTEPLTLLLSWDRSADQRGGCCATFIVHAHVTAEYALERARADYPGVFARIETFLGKPLELAGPVPTE